MKTAKVLACCLLVFPFVGTAPKSGPRARTKFLASVDEAPLRRAPWDALLREGSVLFQAGRYQEALQQWEVARGFAVAAHSPRLARISHQNSSRK